jgi:hypothetical protein
MFENLYSGLQLAWAIGFQIQVLDSRVAEIQSPLRTACILYPVSCLLYPRCLFGVYSENRSCETGLCILSPVS